MNSTLKISIITVSFNSQDTIKDTIESVLSQTYKNIEYIIIDAASTDRTIEIVESFGNQISYFSSAKDEGIYDGMNKGIVAATGDVIGILNSDDIYPNNYVIQNVVDSFVKEGADTLFGDLIYVDFNNPDKVVRYWKSGSYIRSKIRTGWMLPHPTFFVKKKIYDKTYSYIQI